MRKISEKELKKRGIKLKSEDLGRIASSKSSKVISDISKAMQETVKTLDKISTATSMALAANKQPVKVGDRDNGGVQKVEIVGGDDKQVKQWRVRITGRDRDGNIAEMIMEQV